SWNGDVRNRVAIGITALSSIWRGGCVPRCSSISTKLQRSCTVAQRRRHDEDVPCPHHKPAPLAQTGLSSLMVSVLSGSWEELVHPSRSRHLSICLTTTKSMAAR